MATYFYSGPGKVTINGVGLQAQGENGQIVATINEPTTPVAMAMSGRIGETFDDQNAKIVTTPFDNWGLLPTLYPTFLGITTLGGTNAAALAIGTRPHGATNVHAKIFTADLRLYDFVRCAITKHPDLKLGVGEPLFGSCEITALGDLSLNPGGANFLMTANAITESGATDPGGVFTTADFIRSAWTGVWGTAAGFGGDGGALLQAEDFWTISVNAKYSPLKVQRVTRHMKLDSVEIMAKARLVGPSHSNVMAALGTHSMGSLFGSGVNAAALALTNTASGKTITIPQCEIHGAGFEFGGTKLGTGEIGFVNKMTFNGSGVSQPLMIFSA